MFQESSFDFLIDCDVTNNETHTLLLIYNGWHWKACSPQCLENRKTDIAFSFAALLTVPQPHSGASNRVI